MSHKGLSENASADKIAIHISKLQGTCWWTMVNWWSHDLGIRFSDPKGSMGTLVLTRDVRAHFLLGKSLLLVFFWGISRPIGSMYGIYANIGGILMVNVTIYSIHGSYGRWQSIVEQLLASLPGRSQFHLSNDPTVDDDEAKSSRIII